MASAADLQRTLDSLGLGFLFDILSRANIDPTIDVNNKDQLSTFIDASPDAQALIKERFKGNDLRVANGLRPLKPSEYIEQEQAYILRLQNSGMPIGFYDSPDDLAKLIGGDVAPTEFDSRLRQGYQAAMNAPQSVKQQLQSIYGVTESDLAAYFLDPTRATDIIGRKKNANLFGRQIQAAEIAAQGQTQAGIQLGLQTAEDLAAQDVSTAVAQTGFAKIRDEQQLFTGFGNETNIGVAEQISGTFSTNAEARKKIEERRQKRVGSFKGGGSTVTTQAGNVGLGTVGQ